MSDSLKALQGQIDYFIVHNNLSKLEQTHLFYVNEHLAAAIVGQKYIFNCITCHFKSNQIKDAVTHYDHNLTHSMSGPARWFCECGFVMRVRHHVEQHQRIKWSHRVFRFDEIRTLKEGEE